MYEIYEVPSSELDGTEQYIDEAETLEKANAKFKALQQEYACLWIIKCSDEKGYEKVVRS